MISTMKRNTTTAKIAAGEMLDPETFFESLFHCRVHWNDPHPGCFDFIDYGPAVIRVDITELQSQSWDGGTIPTSYQFRDAETDSPFAYLLDEVSVADDGRLWATYRLEAL